MRSLIVVMLLASSPVLAANTCTVPESDPLETSRHMVGAAICDDHALGKWAVFMIVQALATSLPGGAALWLGHDAGRLATMYPRSGFEESRDEFTKLGGVLIGFAAVSLVAGVWLFIMQHQIAGPPVTGS